MKQRSIVAFGLLVALAAAAEPLDRIAVSVGNQVITESTLLLDLRVTAFMNQTELDFSPSARRVEAERLVDQVLILKEANDSHLVLTGGDPAALLAALKARYASEQQFQTDLARYGIRESDLIAHLQQGARAMAFSDLRFSVRITEEEARAYYDEMVTARASGTPAAPSFEASRGEIEELLRGQGALEALDEWLKLARKSIRIEYRDKVFQ